MEEISSTVAVPITLGKLMQKGPSSVTTHMEITGLKLMANTAAALILKHPAVMEEDCDENQRDLKKDDDDDMNMIIRSCDRKNWVWDEKTHNNQKKSKEDDDDFMLAVTFQCLHDSNSTPPQSVDIDHQASTLRTNCSEVEDDDDDIAAKPVQKLMVSDILENDINDESGSDGCDPKPSDLLPVILSEEKIGRTNFLWGFSSICGRRQEMEDAVSVEPQFMQVPSSQVLNMDDHVNQNSKYTYAHFFGVYDGHGGCQVCMPL